MKPKLKRSIPEEVGIADRLHVAREHLKSVGIILSLYSSAIRAINSASTILKTKDQAKINSFAVASALAPIRISPTLTEAFFCAASELYPKEVKVLKDENDASLKNILKLFNAGEISAILGITYFFKLLAKTCDLEEFTRISPIISVQLYIGGLVGAQSGSNFGRGGGLTANGIRVLAMAVLIKANLKAFKKYRRLVEESGILSHSSFEVEHFGCTHLDIASALAGDLGFGPIAREAFINHQYRNSRPSKPEAILWNHTLVESAKLWSARNTLKTKAVAGKAQKTDETLEGYKWLWSETTSDDVLPGIELAEINSLIPDQISSEQSKANGLELDLSPTIDQSVLIVEDDPSSAKILEKYLHPLGTIATHGNAEAVLELLKVPQQSLPFNLILLDVNLPGISGLQLLNSIRDIETKLGTPEQARCKVLMITGDENPQTVMKAFSHGADGYLTKPLKREEVKEELAKHDLILGD